MTRQHYALFGMAALLVIGGCAPKHAPPTRQPRISTSGPPAHQFTQRRPPGLSGSPGIITTVAGKGAGDFRGDGGPATEAEINRPAGIAVGADGIVYIADTGNQRVRKVDRAGTIATIAGNGRAGFSGDGGPAIKASLNEPYGVAVGRDGTVYIADSGNQRIRKVSPKGIITTVAGDGWTRIAGGDSRGILYMGGYRGDGNPATEASLSFPADVAVGPEGSVYIADMQNNRIRKVTWNARTHR